jgi:arabinofuranosyltransferase
MLVLPLFVLLLPVLLVPASRLLAIPIAVIAVWAATMMPPLGVLYEGAGRLTENVRVGDILRTHNMHPFTNEWLASMPALVHQVDQASAAGTPDLLAFSVWPQMVRLPLSPEQRHLGSAVEAAYLGTTGAAVPLEARVVDTLSLAYPLGAHMVMERGFYAGHEKQIDRVWVLADYAAPGVVMPHLSPTVIGYGDISPDALNAARHALSCGRLRELQESVRSTLTIGRFWANLTGAVARTSLRTPRDPFAAEQKFCGTARS